MCATMVLVLTLLQGTPLERYNAATKSYEKSVLLSQAAMGKIPASLAEVEAVFAAALNDPDPRLRQAAVTMIGTIFMFTSMPAVAEQQEWAIPLRPMAETLSRNLDDMTRDTDAGVRFRAWGAIVMRSRAGLGAGAPLSRELVARLASAFADPAGIVRASIVQMLEGNYRSEVPEIRADTRRILLRALKDPDPNVVQTAGRAAFEARNPEVVPLLIDQLENPSRMARLGAAVGLQAYPSECRQYVGRIEAALKKETDGTTYKTLEAALAKIRPE
jgi:HEAT repeat protein